MIFNMVGGGGGSASSAFAIIDASWGQGYYCSATNGTITLTSPDNSGRCLFPIPEPASLPETWTVSTTYGSTTVVVYQKNTVVNAVVKIQFFPDGVAWTKIAASGGTVTISDTGIALSGSSTNAAARTLNTIVADGYKGISVTYHINATKTNTPVFCIALLSEADKNKPCSNSYITAWTTNGVSYSLGGESVGDHAKTYTFDVPSVSGSYYIGVGVRNSFDIEIKKIELTMR